MTSKHSHPELSKSLRAINPTVWRDRMVIWFAAIVAGLCIVAFVWLTYLASQIFTEYRTKIYWLPLILTPAAGMLIVWITQRFAAASAGSGIPQVINALHPDATRQNTPSFVSVRLSLAKAILGAGAIGAGFSTGREGPSVQISAGVMHAFYPWIKNKSAIQARDLILAGGAAGIAAAFNAPLAGIMFAIEELGRRFDERSSGITISAIVLAGLVAITLMGNLTYFGRLQITNVSYSLIGPALLTCLSVGIIGGLFSRLLINSFGKKNWSINQWRLQNPILFAGLCGLFVALLGLITHGAAFGSGYAWSRNILSGQNEIAPNYFLVKFISTWLSFWSGIPGGIFAPSLAIGAGIGHDISLYTGATPLPLIAIGMAAFLAAVTQAPLTSFIIIMEMTDGHTIVLGLMAAVLLSSMVSRLISAPLYQSLASIQLNAHAHLHFIGSRNQGQQ